MLVALSMIVVATGCGKNYKVGENGEVYNDYVKVKQWKGLEVEKVEPVAVTDEDVNLSIESDLQTLTTYVEVKDRGAQNGDQVTLDFVGKLDGVAFEGGTGSDTFILGEGSFVDGFQEGVVGHKAGETFDVPLTFPENYGGDLGGKAVVFTMTLNKVEEVVTVTELTDEVAAQLNPNAKNVEEYKELMKANLEKNNKEDAEAQMRANLVNLLIEQTEMIEYPEELEETITSWIDFMTEQLEYQASMYGMTVEALLEAMGYTEDTFKEECEEMAKNDLRIKYSIELVLDVEEISHTEEDYENFLKEEVESLGAESAEEVEEALESYYGPGGAKNYFLQIKVADFLWENCKIVEPKETETETQTETETESGSETESTEPVTE